MKRSLVINKKKVLKETPFASLTTRPLCLRHGGESQSAARQTTTVPEETVRHYMHRYYVLRNLVMVVVVAEEVVAAVVRVVTSCLSYIGCWASAAADT